jgi:hypothetical protein
MYEKGWAYWRTKANTYASSNWGNPIAPFSALGWSNTGYTPGSTAWSAAAKALTDKRPVCVLTKGSVAAGVPVVPSHAYALVSVNPDGTVSLFNPWGFDGVGDGSDWDDGIVTLTIDQANANLSYVVVTTGYTPPVALPAPPSPPPIIIPAPDPLPRPEPLEPKPQEKPMIFNILKPAMGANDEITVKGVPGVDAVQLQIDTDAESVVMTTPGNAPVPLPLVNGKYSGYISTIPTHPKTLTYTAKKGSETKVKTITLAPNEAVEPTPGPNKIKFFTFDAQSKTLTITRDDNTTQAIA